MIGGMRASLISLREGGSRAVLVKLISVRRNYDIVIWLRSECTHQPLAVDVAV